MASGFTVKVKMNPIDRILKDHGLDNNGRVVRHLRDTADRLMMPYIPRRCWRTISKTKDLS